MSDIKYILKRRPKYFGRWPPPALPSTVEEIEVFAKFFAFFPEKAEIL
tara:strand:- start:337 stop:480 length:144 start_codon:yes stop_codon:yes gene_type:complete